jgi:murein DD-endopeptidase MepM/ murein hydrolase activator NlpD
MDGVGRNRFARGLATLVAACALACAHDGAPGAQRPADAGVVHVVQPGETIWRIARHYGASVEDVVRANQIADVRSVPVGTRLWIPGGDPGQGPPPRLASLAPDQARAQALAESGLAFEWPVNGRLSSGFGGRRGGPHEGIDLVAKEGTAVRSAEAGRVIYSGNGLGDYGNVVIVKHAGRYSTVYAHNRRNRVHKGVFVEKGELIAEVGDTGNASAPHLHFEIRRNRKPQDPLLYLP